MVKSFVQLERIFLFYKLFKVDFFFKNITTKCKMKQWYDREIIGYKPTTKKNLTISKSRKGRPST